MKKRAQNRRRDGGGGNVNLAICSGDEEGEGKEKRKWRGVFTREREVDREDKGKQGRVRIFDGICMGRETQAARLRRRACCLLFSQMAVACKQPSLIFSAVELFAATETNLILPSLKLDRHGLTTRRETDARNKDRTRSDSTHAAVLNQLLFARTSLLLFAVKLL